MSDQVPVNVLKERVVHALKFGFRAGLTVGLVGILFEEALPEPLAKPVVVATVLATLVYNFWSWRRSLQRIHRIN